MVVAAGPINASGRVAGTALALDGNYHAFLWSHGQMQDLGTLPGANSSQGNAINNAGQVVGTAYNFI